MIFKGNPFHFCLKCFHNIVKALIISALVVCAYQMVDAQNLDFSADTTLGCNELMVNFTNLSDSVNFSTHQLFWNFGNSQTAIQNDSLDNPSAVYTFPGSYTVTLYLQNLSGGLFEDSLMMNDFITVEASPEVYLEEFLEICEEDSLFIQTAFALNYSSVNWATSGSGTFDDTLALNPTYFPSLEDIEAGETWLIIRVYGILPCPSITDSTLLSIIPFADAYAGQDSMICEGENYTVNDAVAENYVSLLWISNGAGEVIDEYTLTPTYLPAAGETGVIQLVLIASAPRPCGDAFDTLSLTIEPGPAVDAGVGADICEGTSFYNPYAQAWNYDYLEWTTTGDGVFNDPGILDPVYYPGIGDIFTGMVTLTLTVYGLGNCPEVSDAIPLYVISNPEVYAGEDQEIPTGTSTILYGESTGGSGYYSYLWEPAELLEDPSLQNPQTLNLNNDTEFILTVTDTETGCQNSDSVIVKIVAPNLPPVANDDYDTTFVNTSVTIDPLYNDIDPDGEALTLAICGVDHGTVIINLDNTVTYIPEIDFTGAVSICYYICDQGIPPKCDTASVYVTVIPKEEPVEPLRIATGLTPNGDGLNDYWKIKEIENFPDNEVRIFNRWGNEIHYLKNYNNNTIKWDGTDSRGEALPDGTYFYVLKIQDKGMERLLKGWILKHGSQ